MNKLRDGMFVKLRNGDWGIISNLKVVKQSGGYEFLKDYRMDLTFNAYNGDGSSEDIEDIILVSRAYSFNHAKMESKESIVWKENKSILDKQERKYLRRVIAPFRDKVVYIFKTCVDKKGFITIAIKDESDMDFPYFDKDTMYTNMVSNKKYTLKELGI